MRAHRLLMDAPSGAGGPASLRSGQHDPCAVPPRAPRTLSAARTTRRMTLRTQRVSMAGRVRAAMDGATRMLGHDAAHRSSDVVRRRRIRAGRGVVQAMLLVAVAAGATHALDVITREELKEMALEYGQYDQRFITCKIEPPTSIKIAFLKYAKSRGASESYLDLASKVFDEGRAQVRNLRVGFTPDECKEKLASAKGQEILANAEKWSKLP